MKTEPLTLSQANDEKPFWVGVFEWASKGKIRVAAGPDCEVSVKRYAYCRRNLLFAPTLHGNFIMREDSCGVSANYFAFSKSEIWTIIRLTRNF